MISIPRAAYHSAPMLSSPGAERRPRRVDGWVVLEQQQRVGNQLPLAGVTHLLLQRERVAVTDLTQLTDPQAQSLL